MKIKKIAPALLLFFQFNLLAGQQHSGTTASSADTLLDLAVKIEDWTYRDIDSSRHYACKLIDASIEKRDTYFLATAYTGLAYTYFYQHQLNEALSYLKVSENLYQKIGDSLDISDTYMNFGNVYTEMGFYERGIDYYKNAENYIPKNSEWTNYNLAFLYFNTAETFLDLGDYKNTLEYLEKSEANAVLDSAYELLFAIKNIRAELLLMEEKNEEARRYAQLALLQAQAYDDLVEQAKSLQILASINATKGNHSKAISLQKEALKKAINFGDPLDIAKQYGHFSTILLRDGQHNEALKYAQKAKDYADVVKSQLLYKEISLVLAKALEANNYPNEALQAYKKYYAYNDSLSKININERLLLSQNKIQAQEAVLLKAQNSFQKQIIKEDRMVMIGIGTAFILALIILLVLLQSLRRKKHSQKIIEEKQKLLNAKTEELDKSNQALRQLNEGKDKLFSILTHDLKQPFSQTLQLLEVLEMQMDKDEDLYELTKQVKDTVEDTKNTVDSLLIWSKSQFTNLKTEPRAVYIKPICEDLKAEFKNIIQQKGLQANLDIESDVKVLADANHLEIILRNLLQNAIKFSYKEGKIELRAQRKDKEICIEIIDQGMGMDPDKLQNLFDASVHLSTPGTLNEKGTGLGMLIVSDFVKENKGRLEVESTPNEGSTFRIILPAA